MDEVDTTDLENWALRRRETIGEEDSEDFIHFKNIDGLETQNEKEDLIRRHPWQHRYAIELGLSVTEADSAEEENAKEHEEWNYDMIMRHRLNMTKMLFRRDGHYTLRKFKRLFLREMREQPELYTVMPPSEECPDTEAMSLTEMDQDFDPRDHADDIESASDEEAMLIDIKHLDAVLGSNLYPKMKTILENLRLDSNYIDENSNSEEIEVAATNNPDVFEEYRQILTEQIALDEKSDEEFMKDIFDEEEKESLFAELKELQENSDRRAPLTEKHKYLIRGNKPLPGHTDSSASEELTEVEKEL